MLSIAHKTLQTVLIVVAGVAVVTMIVLINASVLAKNLIGTPIPLTSAVVSYFLMIPIAFLPLGFAQTRNQHVAVDIVFQVCPSAVRRVINLLALIVTAGFMLLMAGQSLRVAMHEAHIGAVVVEQGVDVPVWMSTFLLPIGFLAFAVATLARLRSVGDK